MFHCFITDISLPPNSPFSSFPHPFHTQQLVEDKTFGLKNKSKSAKVQKYVQQLEKQQQVSHKEQRLQDAQAAAKNKKKLEEERQREMNALFAVSIKQPRIPPGVDPKSIVCEFFRHGKCTKGFKCKFAHDLNVERKGGKVDIFTDKRQDLGDGEDEGMEDWDQETLEKAIAQKHGLDNKNRPTEIICRYFLDAVERRLYGWFWQCPNGKDCKYRHGLPAGYVLKSQMKELLEQEAANKKSIEEIIEEERAKVDAKTPITEEVFTAWKTKRDKARQKQEDDLFESRKRKGILTGREIFAEEGFIAQDDIGASAVYEREVDEEAEIKKVSKAAEEAAAAAAVDVTQLLSKEEAEDLFDDDDDDLLDELEGDLQAKAVVD